MKIALSSTFADLVEHRAKISKSIQELDETLGVELVRSEDMSSSAQTPLSEWLDRLDSSDWFILLLGWRYGYVPESEEKSVTELEYEYAKEHLGTVFCFVSDDRFPVPPKFVEVGDAFKRNSCECMRGQLFLRWKRPDCEDYTPVKYSITEKSWRISGNQLVLPAL